jgi:hypothetical protein
LEEAPSSRAASEFKTDFSQHSVPYDEISEVLSKDRIAAIDEPKVVSIEEANGWLVAREPVLAVQIGEEARAYPLQILMWHEIVNDTVGGVAVAATYCPLCNTAIAFERSFPSTSSGQAQVLDFGTTGRLRYSNLIMYDRQTESWWQQATGEAIAGQFTGQQLTFVPAALVSWADFKAAYPEGQVLSRETGYNRDYGQNPYAGYDAENATPFLYNGPETPDDLPQMARVLGVVLDGETVAYPYKTLKEVHTVNDAVGDEPIAVFWKAGTASAMDSALIADGRDVGAAVAFKRTLDGERMSFAFDDDRDLFVDEQTESAWTILGQAVSGPLEGKQLEPIAGLNNFWFSWAAFHPGTGIHQTDEKNTDEGESGGNADVLHVRAVQSVDDSSANSERGTWTFYVTVEHPDTGWEDYADGWDVLTPDGTVLKPDPESPFTRLLLHPHVDEQPFTRSQSGIVIPKDVTNVRVRAHDLVDGYGGREVVVDLTKESGPDYEVETAQ